MTETTEVINAQITFIENGELEASKEKLEAWLKDILDADDVKISNLRRFEMEKKE